MTVLINLPQRFQIVNGFDPFQAGIRLLPMLLSSPVATAAAGQLVSKLQVPPLFVMVAGASLQVVGLGLGSSVGLDDRNSMLGYEAIMGFGFGMTLVTLLIYVPFVVDKSDMGECHFPLCQSFVVDQEAVVMGTVTQVRLLGGTIGLSIRYVLGERLVASTTTSHMTSATLLNGYISPRLKKYLSSPEIDSILNSAKTIDGFSAETRRNVRDIFNNGYTLQLRVMLYVSLAVWLSTILLWERKPRTAKDIKGY
jgi:hypothetical protein